MDGDTLNLAIQLRPWRVELLHRPRPSR